MPFGLFGERMPYTNFHRLNLDWIIKEVKELGHDVSEYKEQLNAMGVSIEEFRAYINSIDSEIHTEIADKVNTEVPIAIDYAIQHGGFDQVLAASHRRRVVVIGDSYGAGWTPDGDVTGFPERIKSLMHIPNNDFFTSNKGGARFGAAQNSEYAFDTVLNNLLPSITNKNTITDIVFAGGFNEGASSYQSINEGIARCKTIIGLNFSNPSLKVYLFAVGYHASNATQRNNLWRRYVNCYARSGWAYTHLTPAICKADWWASDGYHPLNPGQEAIAYNIVNIMSGGTDISKPEIHEFANTSTDGMVWYTAFLPGFMDCLLYGQNITPASPVTLNRTTAAKILDVTTNYPLTSITDTSVRQKYIVHGILQIGQGVYKQADLILYFEQIDRTTYGLYATIMNLNENNSGYAEYQNVTQVQIATNSFHVVIPYQF